MQPFDRDHHAIAALIQRYAACIDSGDLDAMAALFSDATVFAPQLGPEPSEQGSHGFEQVREGFSGLVRDEHGLLGTHHMVFDSNIEVNGERATATSFVTVIHDGKPIVAGRYVDRFIRGPNGWRFHERRPHLDLIGDISGHAPALGEWLAESRHTLQ
jgi:ketosteroid isomerase-like protein